ncbi:MAG: hypothetical protein M1818_003195 [Claussenomyces sp. TS43310]|nr:MAG: hypothetical protein M1818_003195 [Claussenomyces sp. TS43310]
MATQSSPFTQAVVQAVRKIYPEQLADNSFDNTGLLLEAPHRPGHLKNSVLLTVDLTSRVVDEAIARRDSVIVAYHPIIFRGLKALTLANSQQNSLLRLAQEGISVYCPHTAVDAAPGGLNDWLADIIVGSKSSAATAHDRAVLTPAKDISGFEDAGYGRRIRFHAPQKLGLLISRISSGLGNLKALSVAVPQSVPDTSIAEIEISTVGICAGSGGSMLNGLDVDLLFTGELSHHEALAAIEQGKCVITTFHSNTERQFLKDRMRGILRAQIAGELLMTDGLTEGDYDVGVSAVDRDPYSVVLVDQKNQ